MADEIKVVLCGGSGTGKSGLIIRLVTDKVLKTYDPTTEDSYQKILSVDNRKVVLDILDTAGQQQFASMHQFWFREGEIFLIVYSITSRASFEQISHFARKIAVIKKLDIASASEKHVTSNTTNPTTAPPFIIVGNKCDLEDQRTVSTEEGQSLAAKWNAAFFECSTFAQVNLDELWTEAVRLYYRSVQCLGDEVIKHTKPAQTSPAQEHSNHAGGGCCSAVVGQSTAASSGRTTDNIRFLAVKELPPDTIQPPVLALKNFQIKRTFNVRRFCVALLCGVLLPLVLWLQTVAFLLYNENSEAAYFPDHFEFDQVHHSILLDLLAPMIGRQAGQDPEGVKDKRWFLRQTAAQKIARVVLTAFITFTFFIACYNVSRVQDVNLSRAETAGPLFLFWVLWILLSAWIAFEPSITPSLPPLLLTRLRRIELILGEFFTHRTSAYKFLRAYAAARQQRYSLSVTQWAMILTLSLLYALLPGITRVSVGDDSDAISTRVFWTAENVWFEAGACLVNFVLVAIFVFGIEVQFTKHFDSYHAWMNDLTLLISKEQLVSSDEATEEWEERKHSNRGMKPAQLQELIEMEKSHHLLPHKFGRDFSKHLFLSLSRRSNALGWLEIRSFLAIEGTLLFGEQELPTLFLMVGTLSLSLFILFRVYFIPGHPFRSVLFNDAVVLMFVCLVSLIRITITGYKFQSLQLTQERLIGEQKLWIRCNVAQNIGAETEEVRRAAYELKNGTWFRPEKPAEQDTKDDEEEEEEDAGNAESKPLIGSEAAQHASQDAILNRMDCTNWYTYNFGFVDDMLFIVQRKDIYPRLFNVKLNNVLAKALAGVIFSGVAVIFKVFIND